MPEVIAQSEDARHEATANLGRGFTDFAIEFLCFLNEEDARGGMLSFEHERRRRARESAAHDHDVIIKLHRCEDAGLAGGTQRVPNLPDESIAVLRRS